VDAGVSRIVSLPGTEPMGIRVGIYTVIPGEQDAERRELWNLFPYVIGDVLSVRKYIEKGGGETDTKRLQEAARYILESLTALNYAANAEPKPRVVFLHGPLQNSFETYDEDPPYYLPGMDEHFLRKEGLSEEDIKEVIELPPPDAEGGTRWNECIPVYVYIMKRIFESKTPFVGVVERAHSQFFTRGVLDFLADETVITTSLRDRFWREIRKYDLADEFLFGCVLEVGEYLTPIKLKKNIKRRGHDRWQPAITQFPEPHSTMFKTSVHSFPYRIELNIADSDPIFRKIMGLLFHTSLLLPNYAFPVGLDIADKYAKIPDWLSRGVSANLTAHILNKVLQTGNERQLHSVRRLLAMSPRDFFYRPKA
jgi:hypothetical protein